MSEESVATAEELVSALVDPQDFLLALRYHYYVKSHSLVPDARYDEAEKEYLARETTDSFTSPLNEPGSDRPDNYPDRVKALALYFAFKNHDNLKRSKKRKSKK